MRSHPRLRAFRTLLMLAFIGLAAPRDAAYAQGGAAEIGTQVTPEQMTVFARVHSAVEQLRTKAQAELAEPRNKKDENQARIREQLHLQVTAVLKEHGLSQGRFDSLTYLISVDPEQRKAFEAALAQLAATKKSP